jgi:hypothetical protein
MLIIITAIILEAAGHDSMNFKSFKRRQELVDGRSGI